MDMWLTVQSELELALQGNASSTGFCSDISKAFNNLPRLPLLEVAAQMGFPAEVLVPWRKFLARVRADSR